MQQRLEHLHKLLEVHTPELGKNATSLENVFTFREVQTRAYQPQVYEPGLGFIVQGKKELQVGSHGIQLGAGHYLSVFLPMPVGCTVAEASEAQPYLGAWIVLDPGKISRMLMEMDEIEYVPSKVPASNDISGIFSSPMSSSLLDALVRLYQALKDPMEAALLGPRIVDEIYFRFLKEERGGALRYHLQQRGNMAQISRAVEWVHRNLKENHSIEDLAERVNMSASGFHKKFKEIMHVSPLQYAKLIKLDRAKLYLMEGETVSEAGYRVGYNSPPQFSREYKRHFGISPSEERKSVLA